MFMRGENRGRVSTAMTILTDMLIDLNALDIYYQKPSSKGVSPAVLGELRRKVDTAKELLHAILSHNQQ